MYNNEEIIWNNQQIFYFKDKIFNSNGSLELTISNNTTKDFKYFTPANLNIKVSFETDYLTQKQCSLNISKVLDLIESLKTVISNIDKAYSESYTITKRYNNDRNLIIGFKESKNTNEKCVIIRIIYNESNFTNVILPLSEFLVVYYLLQNFEKTYFERTTELKNQAIFIEQFRILQNIENSIKTLPSLMIDFSEKNNIKNYIPSKESFESVMNKAEEIIDSSNTLDELDKFIGGSDMKNIEIPGIEKVEKKALLIEPESKVEIESILIDKVLNNNISVLEDILNASYMKQDPLSSILETLNKSSEGILNNLIVDISHKENKSLNFISNLIFKSILRNYLDNNISIPSSVAMLKYKSTNEVNNVNKLLAIDLLMIHAYLKSYRGKVESKTDDISYTKSLTYLAFRCYMDILCFSVLEKLPSDYIISSVIERFNYYKKKGFFTKFDENISSFKLQEIDINDINNFLNNVLKVLNLNKNSLFISGLHEEYYKKGEVKLPTDNSFSTEQIINDIVKIEVSRKLGQKLENEEDLKKIISNITVEFKKIYLYETSKESDKKSSLKRFVENNLSEIPDLIKKNMLIYIDDLSSNNFDFSILKNLNLRDLGENIIKALYLWKPEEDEKIKTNYTYFINKIKELTLSKEDIINLLSNNSKSSSEWDNIIL